MTTPRRVRAEESIAAEHVVARPGKSARDGEATVPDAERPAANAAQSPAVSAEPVASNTEPTAVNAEPAAADAEPPAERRARSSAADLSVDSEKLRFPALRVRAFRIGLMGALGVGLGLAIVGSIQSLGTVFTYVGIALFLALGLDPVVAWLERRKVKRGVAVAIVFGALLAIFAAIIYAIMPTLVAQIQHFIGSLPDLVNDLVGTRAFDELSEAFAGVINIDAAIQSAGEFLANPANLISIGGGVIAVGAGIASFGTGLIIVLILTLYFIATLPMIKRTLYALVPGSSRGEFESVTEEVTRSVGRYVLGQSSLAAVNGVLSFVFLSIIGAPLPALLAFVAFLGSLIPLVGTLSGSAVIVISCFVADPALALIAGIYYLIYMQVEAYLLSPRIMNKAVAVPGSVVVIAAVAGGTLGGVLGAIVAIPVAASLLIIVRRVVIPHQARR